MLLFSQSMYKKSFIQYMQIVVVPAVFSILLHHQEDDDTSRTPLCNVSELKTLLWRVLKAWTVMSTWITFLKSNGCLCWTRAPLSFLMDVLPAPAFPRNVSKRDHYETGKLGSPLPASTLWQTPPLHRRSTTTPANLKSTKHTQAIHPHIVLRGHLTHTHVCK